MLRNPMKIIMALSRFIFKSTFEIVIIFPAYMLSKVKLLEQKVLFSHFDLLSMTVLNNFGKPFEQN